MAEDPIESVESAENEEYERTRLIPINEDITDDTMDAFTSFIDSTRDKVLVSIDIAIVPSELFYSEKIDFPQYSPPWLQVTRVYMPKINSDSFDEGDEIAKATFLTSRGNLKKICFTLKGEDSRNRFGYSSGTLTVRFGSESEDVKSPKDFKNFEIRIKRNGGELILIYSNGEASYMQLSSTTTGEDKLVITNNGGEKRSTFKGLKQKGILDGKFHGNRYKITQKDGRVTITLTHGNKIQDVIEIDSKIDYEDKFWEIFSKDLIDHPYNANLNLDSWKEVTADRFGLKWVQH